MSLLKKGLIVAILSSWLPSSSEADSLAEEFFWSSIGDQVGSAVSSYEDYKRERALWDQRIAEAEAWLLDCNGCDEAQKEVDHWRGVEKTFNDFAAAALYATGTPPNVAEFLGIDMGVLPPLGQSPSLFEQGQGLVQRPDWIDDAPDFCRGPSEEYIARLAAYQQENRTVAIMGLNMPGGELYDLWRLYVACRDGKYDVFHMEVRLQQARTNGAILPDIVRSGRASVIYYGQVPDSFVPPVPEPDAVRAELEKSGIDEVWLYSELAKSGALSGYSILGFHYRHVNPELPCFQVDTPDDELTKRVCDDFMEPQRAHAAGDSALLLICHYVSGIANGKPQTVGTLHWFDTRPDVMDPARLLRRVGQHPILAVGAPTTACAPTLSVAQANYQTWQNEVSRLRATNPQSPLSVVLPPSELSQSIRDAHAREAEAQTLSRQRSLLWQLDLTGVYIRFSRTEHERRGHTCYVIARAPEKAFAIICQPPKGGNREIVFLRGELGVDLATERVGDGTTENLVADIGARGNLLSEAFEYRWSRNMPHLTPQTMRGTYELQLSSESGEIRVDCVLTPADEDKKLRATCVDANGVERSGHFNAPHRGSYSFDWPTDWSGAPFAIGDTKVEGGFVFPTDVNLRSDTVLSYFQNNGAVHGTLRRVSMKTNAILTPQQSSAPVAPGAASKASTSPPSTTRPDPATKGLAFTCDRARLAGNYLIDSKPGQCRVSGQQIRCQYGEGATMARLLLNEASTSGAGLSGQWVSRQGNGRIEFELTEECEFAQARWSDTSRSAASTKILSVARD